MKIRISILLLIVSFFWHACTSEENWVSIGETVGQAKWFIDINSIESLEPNIKSIWANTILTGPEGKKFTVKHRQEKGLSLEGYNNLAEYKGLFEVNCAIRKLRITEIIDLDKNGVILDSYDRKSEFSNWESLPAGSYYEIIYNKLCNDAASK